MLVHVNERFGVLVAPITSALSNIFRVNPEPGELPKKLVKNKIEYLILPDDDRTRTILRILGYQLPGDPEEGEEEPEDELTPSDVQRATIDQLLKHRRAYVFSDPGTGKTLSVLWTYLELRRQGRGSKMLVVAPLSVMKVWQDEAARVGLTTALLHDHTRGGRIQQAIAGAEADVWVINADGVRLALPLLLPMAESGMLDVLCVDELATFANVGAEKTQAMIQLAAACPRVIGLTGTPCPNGPLDAYSQARIVNAAKLRGDYATFEKAVTIRSGWTRIPRPGWQATVKDILQPAVRFTLDEVVKLPDVTTQDCFVKMGDKQTEAVAASKGTGFGAHHVRLQASAGWQGRQRLDNDARIAELLSEVMGEGQSIIYATYKSTISGLADVFMSQGLSFAVVNGGTPARRRGEIFAAFQRGEIKVLLMMPRCVAHGVTLTAATTVVWHGPSPGAQVLAQGTARVVRIGQTKPVRVVHIQAAPLGKKPSAETKLFAKAKRRLDRQAEFLTRF